MPAAVQPPSGFEHLVERLDHVALALEHVRRALPLVELLGGRFTGGGVSRRDQFRYVHFELPGSGRLELLEPLDHDNESNFLVRFLRDRGEGIHHLTFKVRSLDEATRRAEELGYSIVGVSTDHPHWKEAFIHPKSAHGVLIQLAQWADRPPRHHTSLEQILGADPEIP